MTLLSPKSNIRSFQNHEPQIDSSVMVADGACIIGKVKIHQNANIWFNTVIRGDVNDIHIGENTNIQDNSVVHVSEEYPCYIGNNVTVGHLALVHACHIEDNCLIGMHATVMDGAHIGEGSIIGAGAVVTGKTQIPPHSLVLGAPAKVVKTITPENRENLIKHAKLYVELAQSYNFSS